MKRLLILSVLIFAVVLGVYAEGDELPTIAIMDVAATNTSNVKSQVIYEYIVDVVNKSELYTIVERSALQAAIDEMQIGTSGLVDDTTAAQIGKLAGAGFILISNLIVDDGITYLSTRIVSVESGQVTNTAMLQAGESEYIASLASRTISELLGVTAEKKSEPVKKEDAPASASEEPVKAEGAADSGQTEAADAPVKKSGVSMTIAGLGIVPLLGNGDIFRTGYGLSIDLDFNIINGSTSRLSLGAGTGVFYNSSKTAGEVLFPFNMITIPLSLNLKYRLTMGRIYLKVKIGGGGAYSIFKYSDVTPVDVPQTLASLNPAIYPGLSAGFMVSDSFGIALFGDWSMTFFTARPYAALNAGLAVDINL